MRHTVSVDVNSSVNLHQARRFNSKELCTADSSTLKAPTPQKNSPLAHYQMRQATNHLLSHIPVPWDKIMVINLGHVVLMDVFLQKKQKYKSDIIIPRHEVRLGDIGLGSVCPSGSASVCASVQAQW